MPVTLAVLTIRSSQSFCHPISGPGYIPGLGVKDDDRSGVKNCSCPRLLRDWRGVPNWSHRHVAVHFSVRCGFTRNARGDVSIFYLFAVATGALAQRLNQPMMTLGAFAKVWRAPLTLTAKCWTRPILRGARATDRLHGNPN